MLSISGYPQYSAHLFLTRTLPRQACSLDLGILLGDPKQLRSTVKFYNQNTDDYLVNLFAKQMIISFVERIWSRNFETYMFAEQHRLAAGLEQVFNELFYESKITNAECTNIHNHPGAQEAIDYIWKEYGVRDEKFHICVSMLSTGFVYAER